MTHSEKWNVLKAPLLKELARLRLMNPMGTYTIGNTWAQRIVKADLAVMERAEAAGVDALVWKLSRE